MPALSESASAVLLRFSLWNHEGRKAFRQSCGEGVWSGERVNRAPGSYLTAKQPGNGPEPLSNLSNLRRSCESENPLFVPQFTRPCHPVSHCHPERSEGSRFLPARPRFRVQHKPRSLASLGMTIHEKCRSPAALRLSPQAVRRDEPPAPACPILRPRSPPPGAASLPAPPGSAGCPRGSRQSRTVGSEPAFPGAKIRKPAQCDA